MNQTNVIVDSESFPAYVWIPIYKEQMRWISNTSSTFILNLSQSGSR